MRCGGGWRGGHRASQGRTFSLSDVPGTVIAVTAHRDLQGAGMHWGSRTLFRSSAYMLLFFPPALLSSARIAGGATGCPIVVMKQFVGVVRRL